MEKFVRLLLDRVVGHFAPRVAVPESFREQMTRRQLESYRDAQMSSLIGNAFIAFVITYLAREAASIALSVFLAVGQAVLTAYSYYLNTLVARSVTSERLADRLKIKMAITALAIVIVWVTYFISVATTLSAGDFLLCALIGFGVASAGTQNLAHIPKVAIAFVVPLVVGLWLMLSLRMPEMGQTIAVIMVIYCGTLVNAVSVNYNSFLKSIAWEIETTEHVRQLETKNLRLVEAEETVRLLLHDFENFTSDWLWWCDPDGCIIAPNQRFCEAAGIDADVLAGATFTDLFRISPQQRDLLRAISQRSSFNEIEVELDQDGERRWWQLSGKLWCDAQTGETLGMRGFASDITAVRKAQENVAYLAHYDSLTGLPNRALFKQDFEAELASDGQAPGALLCLDLDGFKRVNDTLGHPVGDALLCAVAQRIKAELADGEWVARLGGDEFMVVIPQMTDERVAEVAECIIHAVSRPMRLGDYDVACSTSIGIVTFDPGQQASDLIRHADLALYDAKASGRNCHRFFAAHMLDGIAERRELETALRQALANDELEMHYQPIVSLETGEVVACEALMRWNPAGRDPVPPGVFIPIAEETGLIIELGAWALREVTRHAAQWPRHLHVTVNISPLQLMDSALLGTIVNALGNSQLSPDRLTIEITETVLMSVSEESRATLHRLCEMGIGIALDDFGTGYSSLNYLKSFPFSKLKIDRCFVADVTTSEQARAIIRAIVQLAETFGITTVAEGVETQEQIELLRGLGCRQAQGFLFSEPTSAEVTFARHGAMMTNRLQTGLRRYASSLARR